MIVSIKYENQRAYEEGVKRMRKAGWKIKKTTIRFDIIDVIYTNSSPEYEPPTFKRSQ